MKKTHNTEISEQQRDLHEITETFKREDEKIDTLEEKVQTLSDEISAIKNSIESIKNTQEEQSQKKTSLFSKILLLVIIAFLCFGGVWIYQQDDKTKALESIGNSIIEKKNAISHTITQASTNISNAKIQEQINMLQLDRKKIEQENISLKEEIAHIKELSLKEENEQKKSRKFIISQLEEKINFLKGNTITEKNPEISQNISSWGEKISEKTPLELKQNKESKKKD